MPRRFRRKRSEPGGKWEATPAAGSRDEVVRAIYEIVSIEKNRLAAKMTVTGSVSKQKAVDFGAAIGGSGEVAMDLDRLMPAKGSLVYRMEASGSDRGGGMKARMDLRIEAK